VISKDSRRLAAAVVGVLLVLFAVIANAFLAPRGETLPARPVGERPQLLLLTSLPILFPEEMKLDSRSPPVLGVLRARYAVVPVSIAGRAGLDGHRLLLMAQPQAQPAETLVELDDWVRRGGHVLLLADPALEWPSNRPFGSVLRPPVAYPDTGLLGHWGLRLDAPDALGPKTVRIGADSVRAASPGTLVATGGNCSVESGLVAHCRIGRGEATVIADADFINAADSQSANLTFLLRELDRLER
jgi:hypothetical protein